MMSLAEGIIRLIDRFYLPPLAALMPRQTFRYAVCGCVTYLAFDPVCYFLIYNYVVAHRFFDLGVVVLSPHIAAMLLVFPFTFSADSGSTATSPSATPPCGRMHSCCVTCSRSSAPSG